MPAEKKPYEVDDDAFNAAIFEDGGNLVVDLGGIQEAKFEVIPKGIYTGEIDSCEYGLSNNSNAPMFTLQLVITEGQYTGRKLYTYISFSQKALPFSKATLNRIAPELLQSPFIPQKIADEGLLLGRPVRMRVSIDDYQGEPRSRVGQLMGAATGDQVNKAAGGKFF
jgi:hypothetical protein